MFRCYIGQGKMSVPDLESNINDWVDNNDEWVEDPTDHELTEVSPIDSDVTYHSVSVRFNQSDTKDNVLQKFTDKLKNKVDWYRVGYHACEHDENNPSNCTWEDDVEWTDKDVTIPPEVPEFQ